MEEETPRVKSSMADIENDRDLYKGKYERRAKLINCVNTALYQEICSLRQLLARRDGYEYVGSTCSIVDLLELIDNEDARQDVKKLNEWLRLEYAREHTNLERYYKAQLHQAKMKLRAKDEELQMHANDPIFLQKSQWSMGATLVDDQVARLQADIKALMKSGESKVDLITMLQADNRRLQRGMAELRDILNFSFPNKPNLSANAEAGSTGSRTAHGPSAVLWARGATSEAETVAAPVSRTASSSSAFYPSMEDECADNRKVIDSLKTMVDKLHAEDEARHHHIMLMEKKLTEIERLKVKMMDGQRKDHPALFAAMDLDEELKAEMKQCPSLIRRFHEFEASVAMERLLLLAQVELGKQQVQQVKSKLRVLYDEFAKLLMLIEELNPELLANLPRLPFSRPSMSSETLRSDSGLTSRSSWKTRSGFMTSRSRSFLGRTADSPKTLGSPRKIPMSPSWKMAHRDDLSPETSRNSSPLSIAAVLDGTSSSPQKQGNDMAVLTLRLAAMRAENTYLKKTCDGHSKALAKQEALLRSCFISLRAQQLHTGMLTGRLVNRSTMTDNCEVLATSVHSMDWPLSSEGHGSMGHISVHHTPSRRGGRTPSAATLHSRRSLTATKSSLLLPENVGVGGSTTRSATQPSFNAVIAPVRPGLATPLIRQESYVPHLANLVLDLPAKGQKGPPKVKSAGSAKQLSTKRTLAARSSPKRPKGRARSAACNATATEDASASLADNQQSHQMKCTDSGPQPTDDNLSPAEPFAAGWSTTGYSSDCDALLSEVVVPMEDAATQTTPFQKPQSPSPPAPLAPRVVPEKHGPVEYGHPNILCFTADSAAGGRGSIAPTSSANITFGAALISGPDTTRDVGHRHQPFSSLSINVQPSTTVTSKKNLSLERAHSFTGGKVIRKPLRPTAHRSIDGDNFCPTAKSEVLLPRENTVMHFRKISAVPPTSLTCEGTLDIVLQAPQSDDLIHTEKELDEGGDADVHKDGIGPGDDGDDDDDHDGGDGDGCREEGTQIPALISPAPDAPNIEAIPLSECSLDLRQEKSVRNTAPSEQANGRPMWRRRRGIPSQDGGIKAHQSNAPTATEQPIQQPVLNTLSPALLKDLENEADADDHGTEGKVALTEDNLRTRDMSFSGFSDRSDHSLFSRSNVPSIIATWWKSCSTDPCADSALPPVPEG